MKVYHLTTEKDLPIGWSSYQYIHKGYRVNYSFRQALMSIFYLHNEFWMIWTDITPLMGYIYLLYYWTHSNAYQHMSVFYRLCALGGYIAAIMTRLCSSIYHIFNPISLYTNQALINLDYIGIIFMSCGFSWVYINAEEIYDYTDGRYVRFLSIMIPYFMFCNSIFIWLLLTNNKKGRCLQVPIILSSASLGSYISSLVILNNNINNEWRICCGIGTTSFIFGYIIFYVLHFPECILKEGIHSIMYSHIWWHNIVTIGQLAFLRTTFIENST